MTEKEIIAWLSRAYWLRIRITKLQEQRRQMQELAEGVRGMDYSKSITQGGEPVTLADAVARLVDLDATIAGEIMRYTAAVDEITAAIKCVDDERLQTVLYLRYVKGERWEQIAVAINYAWRQTHRLHRKAILALSEKMAHNGT